MTSWFPRPHIRPNLAIGHWCPEAAEGPEGTSFFLGSLPHGSFLSCTRTFQRDWAWLGLLILHALSHYLNGPSCPPNTPLVPVILHFPNEQTKLRVPAKLSSFSLKTLIFEQHWSCSLFADHREISPGSLRRPHAEGLASRSLSAQISPIWPHAHFIVTAGLLVDFMDRLKAMGGQEPTLLVLCCGLTA